MDQSEQRRTKNELMKALLGVLNSLLRALQEANKPGPESAGPGGMTRVALWLAAFGLFLLFGAAADWAAKNKQNAEAGEKWKAGIEQALRLEAVRKYATLDCGDQAQCSASVKDIRNRLEAEAAALNIPTPEPAANGKAGEPKQSQVWDATRGRFWLVAVVLCWIGEGLAGLVMLEGILRLAVQLGRRLKLLGERNWEKFNDRLVDRVADVAREGSAGAALLPLLAAATAGGIIYAGNPVSARLTFDAPHDPIPLRLDIAPASGTLGVNLVAASAPVKVDFAAAKEVRVALDVSQKGADSLRVDLERLRDIVSAVNANLSARVESTVRATDGLVSSATALEQSVLRLDVLQRTSTDGYVHRKVMVTRRCGELGRAVQSGDAAELARVFQDMGIGDQLDQPGQMKEYGTLVMNVFCSEGRRPGVLKTADIR